MKSNMQTFLYCYNMKFYIYILVRKEPGHTSTIGFLIPSTLSIGPKAYVLEN